MTAASLLIRKNLLSAIAQNPLIVTVDTGFMDAIAAMEDTGSSCLLVVDSHTESKANNLIGILTEHDIFHVIAHHVPLDQLSMQSVMHYPVITLQESALIDVQSVLNIFQKHRIHHLPVLDGDRLVGLLSQDALTDLLQNLVHKDSESENLSMVAHKAGGDRDVSDHHSTDEFRLRQYEGVFSATTNGLVLLDRNYVYKLVNQVYLDWHHKKQEELIDHSVAELLGESVFQNIQPYLDRCLMGESQQYESWFDYQDGCRRFIKVTYSPYREIDSTITAVVVSLHDLTALKQAEESSQNREQFLRTIYEGVEQAIFTVDVLEDGDFRLVAFNPAAERLTGRLTEEICGKEPVEEVRQHYIDCINAGDSITYEECLTFRDQVTWWITTLNPIYDALGRICRIVGTSTNISQRKKMEIALQNLIESTSAVTGEDFFPALVSHIAKALNVSYAVVTEVEVDRLHTLAIWTTDTLQTNFLYDFAKSPCERTLQDGKFYCDRFLQQQFPEDLDLVSMGVDSYLGIVLRDSHDRAIGTLCILDKQPIQDPQWAENLLRVFAARAAAELERERAMQALEQLNQELETRVQERTAARRQIERELAESEAKFRRLVEGGNDLIWSADQEGRITYLSPQFKTLFGWEPNEWIGKLLIDLVHPDEHQSVVNAYSKDLKCRTLVNTEFRHLHQDGHYLWVKVSATPIINSEGDLIGAQGIVSDISDRKQSELALQESQRFIQRIADASPNILYLYDLQEQRNVYVNREIGIILGYTPDEIQAMGSSLFTNLIHPDDLKQLVSYHAQIYAALDGEILEIEYRVRHVNGEWRWFYGRDAIFKRDSDGHVIQTIGTAQDITERKRWEQEQSHLLSILEASTDYILIADITGQAIWNNTALKRLRGLHSDTEVKQQRPRDYHPQSTVDMIEQKAIPTVLAKGSWVGETVLLDADGQEILVSQLLLGHKSSEGEVEFFSAIMRDIRVQKDYEQQLKQTNAEMLRATRLKDEFLANMSHELRTPLNAILGMSEALQEEVFGSLNEHQKTSISTIESSGQHLLGLINDILELSKIEAGKLELDIEKVSITELCRSSLVFVKQQAFKKQIQLNESFPKDIRTIPVDERRIRQVLINLLTNAVKFTPIGGRVTIEVHYEPIDFNLAERIPIVRPTQLPDSHPAMQDWIPHNDCYVCISIIDNGIGIKPEDQDKLFQPFVQIDSRLNRQYEGTGLGLVLVKRIVELHGGDINLHSELGVGSCFTLRLPYISQLENKSLLAFSPFSERSHSGKAIAESNSIHPYLVLLAEDNEANIMTISSYLSAKGYQILCAQNGQEAIAMALSSQPDLILMDIQMPVMDGLEAMRRIRQMPSLANTPIIALTALAMAGDRDRCLGAGANDYIAKPVKLKQLTYTIEQLLISSLSK
jgi:PAS domain S-box-containing protein